jgi:hypothetical protein
MTDIEPNSSEEGQAQPADDADPGTAAVKSNGGAAAGTLQSISPHVARIARAAARFTFANVAGLLAIAGLLFYAIGILQWVAVLHAEHVPVERGLGLTPFQDYFVHGLAAALDPKALPFLAGLGLGLAALTVYVSLRPRFAPSVDMAAEALTEPTAADATTTAMQPPLPEREQVQPTRKTRKLDRGLRVVSSATALLGLLVVAAALSFVVLPVLFVPVAKWGAQVLLVLSLFIAFILWHSFGAPTVIDAWKREHALAFAAIVVTIGAVYSLAKTWFIPPPLSMARIVTTRGTRLGPAPLLGTSDTAVYVLSSVTGSARTIDVIPMSAIAVMTIEPGPPRHYRTLPELLGLSSGPFRSYFGGGISVPACRYNTRALSTLFSESISESWPVSKLAGC